MAHVAKRHFVDRATEIVGSLIFAAAIAWAAMHLWSVAVAAIVGVTGLGGAFWLLTATDRSPTPRQFFPSDLMFDDDGATEDAAEDDILILDDALVQSPNSRVVRLFSAEASNPAALVARIEDYLERDPHRRSRGQEGRRDEPVPDASAALHAALANIRASLR
nr:hypothetical protein [uncultured Sphingomonas sp.]